MPRKPRFFLPDISAHIVQRGHSRDPVFFGNDDYRAYLDWLAEGAGRYHCAIHAYVLMTNHVHILATPQDKQGISRMMQYVGRRYVPYINHTYGTSGSIWEGRYKASLIDGEQYLLTCMRYIELNPVSADMTRSPGQYRWSSYRANAQGMTDPMVTPHQLYFDLGRTRENRVGAYKALFKAHVDEADLNDMRDALQTGTPLGSAYFRQKIEQRLDRKLGHTRRGRPKRALTP